MSSFKTRNSKLCTEYEAPKAHVISEGDKLIKDLSRKQLNKNIRLGDELSREKQFSLASELVNETAFTAGQNNLANFKLRTEYLLNLEKLKSYGLTDNEIELYNDSKKGEEYLLSKHKNICQSALLEKLNYVLNKVEQKLENDNLDRKEDNFSRHVKDIALSTKPESVETKLFKFAVNCSSKVDNKPLDHPINTLPQLEQKLFGHLNNPNVPPLKKRRKKAKKYLDTDEDINIKPNIINTSTNTLNTKWDKTELIKEEIKYKPVRKYTCEPKRYYSIKNNEIIQLDTFGLDANSSGKQEICIKGKPFIAGNGNNIEQVQLEKLNEEQIKLLPRFHNYEKGTPTNILFLKNLAKKINEEDLINIFSSFDNENTKITYRLLSGKMKGQAFVTFTSVEHATKALELVNGTIIKNKPIIIQYGKSA